MPCADIKNTAVYSESRYFIWNLGGYLNPRICVCVYAVNTSVTYAVDLITIYGYLSDKGTVTICICECVPIDAVVRIHHTLICYDINGSPRENYLFKICERER